MAKNKNQNRQREPHDQHQRSNPATEAQEHTKTAVAEEHGMPTSTQVSRKQHKKFGHN